MSPWQAAKLQRIAEGEFSAQFALSLALKDVRLALQAADDGRLVTLACLADEWQQAVDERGSATRTSPWQHACSSSRKGECRDPDRLHDDGRAGRS